MPTTLRKIYTFNFLYNLHFIGAVLVPFFTEWGGISFTQVMILQSWYSICLFILEVPTGAIADHFGRKLSISLGAFTTAVGVLIYGSYPSFGIFLIGELLFATGAALVSGADQALVYDSLKSRVGNWSPNRF